MDKDIITMNNFITDDEDISLFINKNNSNNIMIIFEMK